MFSESPTSSGLTALLTDMGLCTGEDYELVQVRLIFNAKVSPLLGIVLYLWNPILISKFHSR